jgi:hypothetical protein
MTKRTVLAQESFVIDGSYMSAIEAVRDCHDSVAEAQVHLWNAVHTAIDSGEATWDDIAAATGKGSRQSAYNYFKDTWTLVKP